MQLRGTVVKRPYGVGSKSEHDAVMLEVDGASYRLRRPGGNPFSDPVLDRLVGHTIEAEGTVRESTFFLTSWRVLPS